MKNVMIILSLGFILNGCTKYVELEHCSDDYKHERICSVVARFNESDHHLCHNYKIIYQSAVNYDELEQTGTALARYSTFSNFGKVDVSCK